MVVRIGVTVTSMLLFYGTAKFLLEPPKSHQMSLTALAAIFGTFALNIALTKKQQKLVYTAEDLLIPGWTIKLKLISRKALGICILSL